MKANVDPLTVSDSSPGSEMKGKNALSSAPSSEPVSGPKSAASEPRHTETQKFPPAATPSSADAQKTVSGGLTSDEARRRLAKSGPNAMPDTSVHPLRMALEKFWAPVPWMLEAAIVLELVLGKYVEAAIIALLLVFNAALGLFQESRAQATLAALKSRLALTASVRRDGAWKTVPATELVPGDLVKLSLGGVVAADVKLTGGEVLLDQSMLTGESVPIEAGAGVQTYAGALVRRGEAEAEVTATGARTKFGRTAELVRTAHVVSSQQKAVLRVVRNLAVFNGVVIVLLVAYAWYLKMPVADIIPLVLTAILASIPVALPATFTLASALGARALAKLGVLPTRLSAVDEAASMVVLCADKTGTLTQNALTVTTVRPMAGLRRGPCSGAGGARQFGWRRGPGRWRHTRGRRKQAGLRRAEADQIRPLRSGQEDVRGDRNGCGGNPAAYRKGRLHRRHRPCPAVADRGGRRPRNSRTRASGCWRSPPDPPRR